MTPGHPERLELEASVEEVETAVAWLDGLLAGVPMGKERIRWLHLCVEEVFANIVSHGLPYGSPSHIVVFLMQDSPWLWLRFEDEGIPFDPTAHPPADIESPVEERKLGGLGIHLVMKKMDRVSYERVDGKNILTVGLLAEFTDGAPASGRGKVAP